MLEGATDWPQDFVTRYQAKGYWKGVALGDAFVASVARHADRVAVVDGSRRVTYAELGRLVDRMAHHFVERRLVDGARIVFQLPNSLEFVVAYFAALRVGAIPVCCLPSHRHHEMTHLCAHAEAEGWLIASELRGFDYVAMVEEIRPSVPSLREILVVGPRAGEHMTRVADLLVDPAEERAAPGALEKHRPAARDVAVFQLSGGTTGLPKIIPRTHDDYLYNSLQSAKVTGFGEDDVFLVSVPIAHNFPLACPGIQAALLLGARVVIAPSPAADVIFPLIAQERVTCLAAVPATAITWSAAAPTSRHDLSSIRTIYVGGQRLNPEAGRALVDAFGPVLCQVFGMAEGLLCYTRRDDPLDVILETQGRPICEDDEVLLLDDEGKPVADGELGELCVRGPYTLRGYFRAEEHNKKSFTRDGFYRSGDLVRRHPSGNLVVEGRSKDVINRGGEKIGAEDVENEILAHPAVHLVAVVAMPDPVLGERVCAFVVCKPGASLALSDLVALLKPKMAAFKIPERLELRDSLPLTPVGKISKKDLREEIKAVLAREAKS